MTTELVDITKGPWGIDPDTGILYGDIEGARVPIAQLVGLQANPNIIEDAIALPALPDLLELAKRTLWLTAQEPYPGRRRDELAIHAEAEVAIAKARGTS